MNVAVNTHDGAFLAVVFRPEHLETGILHGLVWRSDIEEAIDGLMFRFGSDRSTAQGLSVQNIFFGKPSCSLL